MNCKPNSKKLCGREDCNTCSKRSFANHEKSKYMIIEDGVNIRQINSGTSVKYPFKCNKCNHTFYSGPKEITKVKKSTWCPYCSNNMLCDNDDCKICYNKTLASHKRSKYFSTKNELKPREIFLYSQLKYIFDCDKCHHDFEVRVGHVTKKNKPTWCPYCSNQKLCDKDDCNDCYNKSFASYEKKQFFSSKNKDSPREIFLSTHHKYIFNCDKCHHNFLTAIAKITGSQRWCPYCVSKKLCDDINCMMCLKNSFKSHEKSKYWSNKNDILPRQTFISSDKKYFFDCNQCNHTFYISLTNINNQNHWCPYCSNQKLCKDDKCNICFNKSFASHEKCIYFSKKNKLIPREIFKRSGHKYYFKCNKCNNTFYSSLNAITNPIKPAWCPFCKHKTETKILDWLQESYRDYKISYQYKFDWCKNTKTNRLYAFDFVIEELNLIIELDGLQHFKQVSNWSSPELTQEKDIYKMLKVNEKGYTIIRILQEDVLYNKNNWEAKLKNAIKIYESPDYIFISENNEYQVYLDKIASSKSRKYATQ